jgi:hypothetical protein
MKVIGNAADQECGRWLNNRAERHLNRRDIFKQNRSVALAEWRQLAA